MRIFALALAAALFAACSGGGGTSFAPPAQDNSAPQNPTTDSAGIVPLSQAAIASVPGHTDYAYHLMPVRKPGQAIKPLNLVAPLHMSYGGGLLIKTALQHNIFVDGAATVWGTPSTFETNLSNSAFIHSVDQYVGSTANNRYPIGTQFSATVAFFDNPKVISENQILGVVHAAAASGGHGTGHVYHVFLPPGVNHCFDLTTICYSPSAPANFFFCAYHGTVTFTDTVGQVFYSVEPYQHVPGCGDDFSGLTLPNAVPVDDTATTLSHEMFETFSDPVPGTGFTNGLISEIGDACFLFRANMTLNGHHYLIQPEYSNNGEACFFTT
jgi:hypothetical protein